MARRLAAMLCVLGVLLTGATDAQTIGTDVTDQCPLTAPLVVRDLQGGVVGQTGTVWTLAPDCSFTVARQIGANAAEPHKRGRLTAEQQRRLAALLDRLNPATLPARLGGAPRPNAREIALSYGTTNSVLTAPPTGASPAGATAPAARLQELAQALKEMLG